MKPFYVIAVALVQVLATASIVFVTYEGGFAFIRPSTSGIVAFAFVFVGASFQAGKEIQDWIEDKKKADLVAKAKQSEDARAIYGLESLCDSVNFMFQWMAAECKIVYPCQENDFPNWFYVHNMYRTEIIRCWTSRKALSMERMQPHDWRFFLSILESWRKQIDGGIAILNKDNKHISNVIQLIRSMQRQVDSNWGRSELTDSEMSDSKVVMNTVQRSLQEVTNSAEFIYPILKKEEYARGRQHCAEVQKKRYPNPHYTDLIFH
jgi:hypothetical protein